jgi:ureidoglycolate lyase
MNALNIQPLTREAFAPFGEVIMLDGAKHYPINAGTTERFHALARVDATEQGGVPVISLFRGQPRPLPLPITPWVARPLCRSPSPPTMNTWWWSRQRESWMRAR